MTRDEALKIYGKKLVNIKGDERWELEVSPGLRGPFCGWATHSEGKEGETGKKFDVWFFTSDDERDVLFLAFLPSHGWELASDIHL